MSEERPSRKGVVFLIAMTVVLIAAANGWKTNLKLKQISVEGNRIVGTNEILQLLNVHQGALLYNVDLTALQQKVLHQYYIKDVVIERDFPNALHVTVTERIPLAMVNDQRMLYLDEEGIVLPRGASRILYDLPIVSGLSDERLAPGSKIVKPDVREALAMLAAFKATDSPMYHTISEIQVRNGGDMVLYAADTGVPIIYGRGNMAEKLARLEAFWNDVVRVRGSKDLDYVDLRYRDQVVVRWNTGATVPAAGIVKG
jgi:cell division protein FtsQ